MLTNKKIIEILLPYVKEGIENIHCDLRDIDYYKHPYIQWDYYLENGERIAVTITDYDGVRVVEAYLHLEGRYDGARITYQQGSNGYGYAKEFKGMGNGFYADLDIRGKIIRKEWD